MQYLHIRNKLNDSAYSLLKNILFRIDPEKVHNSFLVIGKNLGKYKITKNATSSLFNFAHPSLEQNMHGIKFPNPVGLSAGFDKDAELTEIIPEVGFGFMEVGSITAKSYEGNKGPRLKRIIEKQSIWVNYGLKNKGAIEIKSRLNKKHFKIPLGISVAKTNCRETVDTKVAIEDYIFTIKEFKSIGDYFTINISCPNAFGGQPFSSPRLFKTLMDEIEKLKIKKPIFIKLSPDLGEKNISSILNLSLNYTIAGFICSNLTKKEKNKSGGLSGKSVEKKSNNLLSQVYKFKIKNKKQYIIIGSGGVFSAQDAYKKIKLGANLIQLITGMIYKGPALIGEINQGLVELLKKDKLTNISQAVGLSFKNHLAE